MTKKSRRITGKRAVLAALCCMALVCLPVSRAAAAETSAGAVGTASEGDITITLSTDKEVYRAGEEIQYAITVENGSAIWDIGAAEFTYSNTEGLIPVSEGSMPASLPAVSAGESYTLTGAMVGDGEIFKAPGLPVWIWIIIAVGVAAVCGLVFILMKKKKGRKTTAAALLLALCMVCGAVPVRAAGDTVTLRPYVKFEYAGQEVMLRIVVELPVSQKLWEIAYEDRMQYQRITCHDPSIFKDFDGTYYIFGTHLAGGSTTNLYNWTSLDSVIQDSFSQEVRDQVKAWNDDDSAGSWYGYLWAPDMIYNPVMEKYCMYLSANGDDWKSNIVLLTADEVLGPYEYAGTIVYGGFNEEDFGETDAPYVLGTEEIPERYVVNGVDNKKWGDMWPNCIDPCVFYDEEGRLWMTYGSWSGGIFMLELDEETGLRDYTVSYDTDIHSDAYFGKKIAGGAYVSGEGSYVQKIGDYYYLFISYGNLEAAGGYNVRVFRSERPDGDYVDALGNTPYFDKYAFNYNMSVGVRLMGGYQWRNFNNGQVAQGHNSAFVDDDGRAYIVYHTRTSNGTEGHYVKVHQLFVNKEGWLVAAPYQTTGEALKSGGYTVSEVAGQYEVILHELEIDYKALETKKPQRITLEEDGRISGDYTGSWSLEPGTSYIVLSMDGVNYSGVTLEMLVENTTLNTMVFTALGDTNQVTLWGSRVIE